MTEGLRPSANPPGWAKRAVARAAGTEEVGTEEAGAGERAAAERAAAERAAVEEARVAAARVAVARAVARAVERVAATWCSCCGRRAARGLSACWSVCRT